MKKVEDRVVRPTVAGLAAEGIIYNGFIFFGLINVEGEPFVIEYNCRMGDPETEVVMPRLQNDLLELFTAVKEQSLDKITVSEDPRAAATMMLVSGGYPEAYEKGKEITGIPAPTADQIVFHAGTKADGGKTLTNGGRVLAITSLASDLQQALAHSRETAESISFGASIIVATLGMNFNK